MIKRHTIEPIDWTPYTGETINTNLVIRGGQKFQETAYYKDKVKAVPRGNAYIIGNGPSRAGFDLNKLKATGQTYGCNAIYRDFMPDFIFSVDTKITTEMCENEGMLHLIPNNPHWISGNVAFWTACVHGHKNLYLLGFDFREYGRNQNNNIYQDSENYGERHSDTVFDGWLKQFRDHLKMRPYCHFTIVHDNPPEYLKNVQTGTDLGNSSLISYEQFNDVVSNQSS
jgi:hypothetical protein